MITAAERRRWSTEKKLAIVAEGLTEGAVVSEVACRHFISPPQLFGSRAKVRAKIAEIKAVETVRADVRSGSHRSRRSAETDRCPTTSTAEAGTGEAPIASGALDRIGVLYGVEAEIRSVPLTSAGGVNPHAWLAALCRSSSTAGPHPHRRSDALAYADAIG